MHEVSPSPMTQRARSSTDDAQPVSPTMHRGRLVAISSSGDLIVDIVGGQRVVCDVLLIAPTVTIREGDLLLVLASCVENERGVVLGRVGAYQAPGVPAAITIAAAESMSLSCGKSSIDLHADGKVMIRGEDVLVRAKGMQRIKAGTVSIN